MVTGGGRGIVRAMAQELAKAGAAIAAVARSEDQLTETVALIEGEAGIGKTRTAEEFAAAARGDPRERVHVFRKRAPVARASAMQRPAEGGEPFAGRQADLPAVRQRHHGLNQAFPEAARPNSCRA